MISFVVLLPLYLAATSSALKFHSPIRILRPLEDVHDNCDQYVKAFCNEIDTHSQDHLALNSYESLTKTKEGASSVLPEVETSTAMEDTSNERPLEYHTLNNSNMIAKQRRLNEVEPETKSKVKKVSVSISVRVTPKAKDSKESVQRAKNSKRVLNYGPQIDTCLWNAFDSQHVPSACASALTYVNDSLDPGISYEENRSTSSYSISFSGLTLLSIIFACYLVCSACKEHDEDDEGDEDDFYGC